MIPVIDIFAGPGGLGEGFARCETGGRRAFRIALSIEKDPIAHRTLELRAFYRQFPPDWAPELYYDYLRGCASRKEMFEACPRQAEAAKEEALHATLGVDPAGTIDDRITRALRGARDWVLIGGPPCQAYSLAGRSRVGGIDPADHCVYLYREYLRILARHAPPVFVMENVKGLLSSSVNGEPVFEWIRRDLQEPHRALRRTERTFAAIGDTGYRLYSLVDHGEQGTLNPDDQSLDAREFVIRSERYGIPQARHRVIILGVRDDILRCRPAPLAPAATMTVGAALRGLPRLRSGLSQDADSAEAWIEHLRGFFQHVTPAAVRERAGSEVLQAVRLTLKGLKLPRTPRDGRGGMFVECKSNGCPNPDWFHSHRLHGACNHESRGHIVPDLYRYLYAACFAQVSGRSPELSEFPTELLPNHESAAIAVAGEGHFADRFRVQVKDHPATTITSHISRDGHYYIHPDPEQCRNLTVREAARLQTFPDTYFFEGNRTAGTSRSAMPSPRT